MIVNDKFVFLHLQKTGGAFISNTLVKIFPGSKTLASHRPRKDIPEQYQYIPCFGFVRNPWDWYVSWYSYFSSREYTTPIFGVVSDNKKLGFKQTMLNLFDTICQELAPDVVNEEIMRHYQTGEPMTPISQRIKNGELPNVSGGLLSGMFTVTYSKNGAYSDVRFGRQENLRQDLVQILEELGCRLTEDQRVFIQTNEATNQSTRGNYRDYYDAELRKLVQKREAEYIDYFQYTF